MGSITSFAEARAALWRQAWLILIVLAIGLPAAYVYATRQPRIYQAVGVLTLEMAQGGGDAAAEVGISKRFDEVQQALLARDNVKALADRLNLFSDVTSEDLRIALVRESISINRLVDPSQAWRPDVQPYGLSIVARLNDPDKAAELANTLLDALIAEDDRRARDHMAAAVGRMSTVLEYLLSEEGRVGEEIAAVENEIADFREVNAVALPENLDTMRLQLLDLKEQELLLDQEVATFDQSVRQLRPEVAARRRDQLEERRANVLAEIAAAEAAIAATPGVERDLGALNRRLQGLETELGAITMQRTEAAMSQSLARHVQSGRLIVLESVRPSEFPISTPQRKIAMAGGLATVMLALGLAIAREMLNPVLRTAAQMQRQLSIEPVVSIPYVRSRGLLRRRLAFASAFLGLLLVAAIIGTAVGAGTSLSCEQSSARLATNRVEFISQ